MVLTSLISTTIIIIISTFGPRSPGWSVNTNASSFSAVRRNFLFSRCMCGLKTHTHVAGNWTTHMTACSQHTDTCQSTTTLTHWRLRRQLPVCHSQSLQWTQNSAARLIFELSTCEHVIPCMLQLHWLPVSVRTKRYRITKCNANWTPCDLKCHMCRTFVRYKKTRSCLTKTLNITANGNGLKCSHPFVHSSI